MEENEKITLEPIELIEPEEFDLLNEAEKLMPKMELNLNQQNSIMEPLQQEPEKPCIIEDEYLLDLYGEILQNIRDDRKEASEMIDKVADMVLNDGDATSASKEALVNLIKAKNDLSDKMAKIADLATRIKLKDKDTFPKYLAANQTNNITIDKSNVKREKRSLIQTINKAKKNNMIEKGS